MDYEVKCPNFIICNTKLPQWVLDSNNGTCIGCQTIFGKILNLIDNIECPICFEIDKGIQQLDCNHSSCINCFKRSHMFDWNYGEPSFPYPSNIETEYYQNQDDIKWENDELIKKYNEDYIKFEDEKCIQYDNEEYLRKCPLCRK